MKRSKKPHSLRHVALSICLGCTLLCMAGTIFNASSSSSSPVGYTRSDSLLALLQVPQQFYNARPNLVHRSEALRPFFQKVATEGQAVRILQLGDSHVAGKIFPNSVAEVLQEAWGGVVTDTLPRLRYEFIAKNGATMHRLLTSEVISTIAALQPHLIILSFGTNECHALTYDEQEHLSQLKPAFEALRSACPEATFLVTTPPGAYLKHQPNPMTMRCSSLLGQFAEEYNLAFWNLNEIAGGAEATENYMALNLMRPDRVHFTVEGYQIFGRLLGEALLTAQRLTVNG